MTSKHKPLTKLQEDFAQAFVEHGVGSVALRQAKDCSKMKDSTVTRTAYDLVHHPRVRARINELRDLAASDLVMTRREALERLSARARVNFFELIEFGETVVRTTESGEPVVQATWKFKDRESLTPEQLAAITELTAGPKGLTVKTHDPVAAMALLSRMQGWEAPRAVELSGPGKGPVQVEVVDMSDEQLLGVIQGAADTD